MIPKTIHYCWFGRGEMPQLAKDCIASWHRHMPDWDYKLWNEDNFDVDSIPYTREAYAARKYAFVTDYVRLYALSTEGGVYMDTDVEILKPLDDLLHLSAFTGYEGSKHKPPVTGLMASEAGGQWVEEQLHAYDGLHFRRDDGILDTTTGAVKSALHRGRAALQAAQAEGRPAPARLDTAVASRPTPHAAVLRQLQEENAALRERLERLCSAGGLDPDIARQWSVLREVANCMDYARDGKRKDAERSRWVAAALAA